MWIEHEPSQRVNEVRWAEIQQHDVSLAVVACPFCLIMLDTAASSMGGEILARKDIAEVVAEAMV